MPYRLAIAQYIFVATRPNEPTAATKVIIQHIQMNCKCFFTFFSRLIPVIVFVVEFLLKFLIRHAQITDALDQGNDPHH